MNPRASMNRTADLDAALSFVIERIAEQARLSGKPLSVEERFLLDNLPSDMASTRSFMPGHPEIVELVPRNMNYERLSTLGKAAYLNDREMSPTSFDWEFAFAVFALKRDPMWGLLHYAGVRIYRRSTRDYFLMIIAGLLPLMAAILLASNARWNILQMAGIFCGCVGIMLSIYFASLKIERRKLENHIERYRLASRFVNPVR